MLNPIHDEIFKNFPLCYYWSAYESEWASDIAFKSPAVLTAQRITPGQLNRLAA